MEENYQYHKTDKTPRPAVGQYDLNDKAIRPRDTMAPQYAKQTSERFPDPKEYVPEAGQYDPCDKSVRPRDTMAPQLAKQTSQRFPQPQQTPDAGEYQNFLDKPYLPTERRNTMAYSIELNKSQRFQLDKDQVNNPAPGQYDVTYGDCDERVSKMGFPKSTSKRFE